MKNKKIICAIAAVTMLAAFPVKAKTEGLDIDSYKIEIVYWNMDDEKYPGANFISIWNKG